MLNLSLDVSVAISSLLDLQCFSIWHINRSLASDADRNDAIQPLGNHETANSPCPDRNAQCHRCEQGWYKNEKRSSNPEQREEKSAGEGEDYGRDDEGREEEDGRECQGQLHGYETLY